MIKILFICHGNICRSTMAQFLFQDMVNRHGMQNEFYINSAATSREEIGRGPHYGTVRKLKEAGIPILEHRAVQMTSRDYHRYDYLIGMDAENMRSMERIAGGDPEGKMFKLLEFAGKARDIADPWYTGNFDRTYADIREGCEALLKKFL